MWHKVVLIYIYIYIYIYIISELYENGYQTFAYFYLFQTQDCNWRRGKTSVKRKRRALSDTNDENDEFEPDVDDIEFNESILTKTNLTTTKKNDSLSDNISLFQAIHVLQSKEDENDKDDSEDDTKAGKYSISEFHTNF